MNAKRTLILVPFTRIVLCFLILATTNSCAKDLSAKESSAKDSLSIEFQKLRTAKKVTLKFRGYWPDTDTSPSNGIELNRAFEELDSVYGFSYLTSDRNSIAKLIEILNKSVVKSPSLENPQLMYVNLLIKFEWKDQTETNLLIGKYYEADTTIEAELQNNKDKIKTIVLDKTVHKTLRDWILNYAQIDKEKAFSNFQKECQLSYSREIKNYEETEAQQNKLFAERGQVRPSSKGDTRHLLNEEYKAKLARCNDPDNPGYQKKLKRHLDVMVVNYFKNDANQVCDQHNLYHIDPNYCAARGEWQPSYNQWNINNLEDKRK